MSKSVSVFFSFSFSVFSIGTSAKIRPEEVSIGEVVDRQVKAGAEIQSLIESVNESLSGDHDKCSNDSAAVMTVIAASLDKQMSTIYDKIQNQLDHLNAICCAMSTKNCQTIYQEAETKPMMAGPLTSSFRASTKTTTVRWGWRSSSRSHHRSRCWFGGCNPSRRSLQGRQAASNSGVAEDGVGSSHHRQQRPQACGVGGITAVGVRPSRWVTWRSTRETLKRLKEWYEC